MHVSLILWGKQVANQKGGVVAAKQVAFLWAKNLGSDSAVKLLNKMNLLEACIDYACETYQVGFVQWMDVAILSHF